MIAILRETADTLANGAYVTLSQFLAWDEILTKSGVRRRVLSPLISTEKHHPGINIDFIEGRPSGEAWDRIDAYDQLLVNHGEWDIIPSLVVQLIQRDPYSDLPPFAGITPGAGATLRHLCDTRRIGECLVLG